MAQRLRSFCAAASDIAAAGSGNVNPGDWCEDWCEESRPALNANPGNC